MTHYTIHSPKTAPAPADQMLEKVNRMLGFTPNVFAVMGGTPPVLKAFVEMNNQYAQTSLTPTEREIIQIAVSVENECSYCVAGHTVFARMQKVPEDVISAVRSRGVIDDPKLAALHVFARTMMVKRGHLEQAEIDTFLAAGYGETQMQEVILGVCVKVFSNLTSVSLDIPLDPQFVHDAWDPAEAQSDGANRRAA